LTRSSRVTLKIHVYILYMLYFQVGAADVMGVYDDTPGAVRDAGHYHHRLLQQRRRSVDTGCKWTR